MAMNKANTSVGVKIVLVFLIISVVVSFISFVPGMFGSTTPGQPGQPGTDPVSTINAQYSPQVQALEAQLASDPESYTAMVNLGNAYIDWGSALQASGDSTTAAAAALPVWRAARDLYGRALEIKGGEAPVEGNYALALYSLGDVNGAIKAGEQAIKSDPKMIPGWLNLGNFYASANRPDDARRAWQQVIKIAGADSPQGQQAEQAIAKLQSQQGGSETASPTAP